MADEVIRIKTIHDDQASRSINSLKNTLKAAFGAVSVAMIANFTVKMVKLASTAEEVANKFNVVFKGADKAKDSIKKLSQETGYAVSSLQKMASNLGDLIKPAGFASEKAFELSERIVKLALDIGSFSNTHPDQVIMDFQSALAGSSETLQKYGIDARETTLALKAMNMGLIDNMKSYSKLDPEQKRQVRTLALIEKAYDDSQDAIGDLNRTSESYANQTRILNEKLKELGEQIGTVLLPYMTSLVTRVNSFIDSIRKIEDSGFYKFIEKIIELNRWTRERTGMQEYVDSLNEMKQASDDLNESVTELSESKDDLTKANKEVIKTENELLEAFITELEWLEKLEAKNQAAEQMRLESQREHYQELEDLKREANENLDKLRQEDWEKTLESAEKSYQLAKEQNRKIEESRKENLDNLRDIERQKRYEQQRSLLEFQDNLRVWGQESKTAFEMYKAWASAESLISAIKSAQSIFEAVASSVWLGPAALPAAIAASAVAMAAGVARAGMIASQEYQGRAQGGDVQAGMPYIVGERGREMFVPDLSGYIIPNNVLKKLGGKSIVINVNAMDVQSFRDFLRRGGANVLESEVSKGKLF